MRCEKQEHQPGQRCPAKMPSAKPAIKLDISTVCAIARRSLNPELTLLKAPKTIMTMKIESDNQIHQG